MRTIRNVALLCVLLTVVIYAGLILASEGKLPFTFKSDEENLNAIEQLEYYSDRSLDDYTLCVKMPTGVELSEVRVDFDYVSRDLVIVIPKIRVEYFYENHLMGGTEYIESIAYRGGEEEAGFTIRYHKVFEFEKKLEDGFLYIRAREPREIYDYIVVVDAGHGGDSSPGTVWRDTRESDINLAIAEKLEELLEASPYHIGVYMTRDHDVDVPLASRVGLSNVLGADLFISVHNNTNGLKRMDDTSGTEVLYNDLDESGASERFAEICLNKVTAAIATNRREVVAGSEKVQILRESEAPVALVEVGFMSCQEELENLKDGAFQAQAAKGMYQAIIEMLAV